MKNIKERKNKKKKSVKRKGLNAKLIRILVFCFLGISVFSFILAFSNSDNDASNIEGNRDVGNLGRAPRQFLITSQDFKDKEKPIEDEPKEDAVIINRTKVVPVFEERKLYNRSYSETAKPIKESAPVVQNTKKSASSNPISSFLSKRNLSPNTAGIYANLQSANSGDAGSGAGLFGNVGSVMENINSMVDSTLGGSNSIMNNSMQGNNASASTLEISSGSNILEGGLVPPVSDRIIQAGTLIPVTMITGINSDIPGDIIGQVSRNIYDSIRGKYLLIPAGSKLLGSYNSSVMYGQERLLIAWTRLIRPDGSSIDLQGMRGVDLQGYAGYSDSVDNHWGKIMAALGIATVINIANLELNDALDFLSQFSSSTSAALRGTSSQVNDLAGRITDRALDIQPTIKIKPGIKVNLFISKDIILPEED